MEENNKSLDISVQIGCHQDSLISMSAPWKRWPILSSFYPLKNPETLIASPYGGIVYLISSEFLDFPLECHFTFSNFVQYPRMVKSNPQIWDDTKHYDIPFGEYETDFLIFSMPSANLRDLQTNFNYFNNIFDLSLNSIFKFTHFDFLRKFRVIFDIEISKDLPACHHPIVLPISDIPELFNILNTPTAVFYSLIKTVSLLTIKENHFETEVEDVFAELATQNVMKKIFPDFNSKQFANPLNDILFNSLYDIQMENKELIISKVLSKFQSDLYHEERMPEENWLEFIQDLCIIGKTDYTEKLETYHPIPLSVVNFVKHSLQHNSK